MFDCSPVRDRSRLLIGFLVLMNTAILSSKEALADTPEDLQPYLTGGGSRTWDLQGKPWVAKLGSSCESGQRWAFSGDGIWTIKTCSEGTVNDEIKQWAWVESEANEGPRIRLDSDIYRIRIRSLTIEGDPDKLILVFQSIKLKPEDTVEETHLTYQEF